MNISYDFYKFRYTVESAENASFYRKMVPLMFETIVLGSFAVFLHACGVGSTLGSPFLGGAFGLLAGAVFQTFRMMGGDRIPMMMDPEVARKMEKRSTPEEFETYLYDRLATCASLNRKSNLERGRYFYRAQLCLLSSLALIILAAIAAYLTPEG